MRTERKIKPQTKKDIPRVTSDMSVSEATAGGAERGASRVSGVRTGKGDCISSSHPPTRLLKPGCAESCFDR